MHELIAGEFPFEPKIQRFRDYMRQRQMTLGDLLLENRIVFLGSSPKRGAIRPSPITWQISRSRSSCFSNMRTAIRRFIFTLTVPVDR